MEPINGENLENLLLEKTLNSKGKQPLTLLYYLRNIFWVKCFETEKNHRSRLLLCIFLPSNFINDTPSVNMLALKSVYKILTYVINILAIFP